MGFLLHEPIELIVTDHYIQTQQMQSTLRDIQNECLDAKLTYSSSLVELKLFLHLDCCREICLC